jgi:hypothetical protein
MALPEPYTLTHHHWVQNVPYEEDAHGNAKGHWVNTVRRFIASRELAVSDVVDAAYVGRSVTDMEIAVRDPAPYGERDEVTVDGVRYQMQGRPLSDLKGPFPQYNRLLGGRLRVRRVT